MVVPWGCFTLMDFIEHKGTSKVTAEILTVFDLDFVPSEKSGRSLSGIAKTRLVVLECRVFWAQKIHFGNYYRLSRSFTKLLHAGMAKGEPDLTPHADLFCNNILASPQIHNFNDK